MSRISSSTLPFATLLVRLFIVLNILFGATLLALLLVMPNREWIISALDLSRSPDLDKMVWGLRSVAALGVVCIVFNHLILRRLLAILESVGLGDPFVSENAYRLQAIAWFLLALQLLSLVISVIGDWLSTPQQPIELSAGVSPAGWLAVLLTFVLAQVFAQGALMRRDLEGTI